MKPCCGMGQANPGAWSASGNDPASVSFWIYAVLAFALAYALTTKPK